MTDLQLEIEALRAEKESFCMGYRMIVDEQTKALHTKIEMLEAELANARAAAQVYALRTEKAEAELAEAKRACAAVVEFCDKNPPTGESLYCVTLCRKVIAKEKDNG